MISLFNKYRLLLYSGVDKSSLRSVDIINLYFSIKFDCLSCNPFCSFLSAYLDILKMIDILKGGN